ncbi:hypothetical protein U1Q18_000523 [Sarracenia purpurea var. burkii]
MFPLIGSGRFITAPVISEDGEPIQDPIVLLEANPDKGTLIFYEKQENLSKLWDILAVYAWFDTDVGYCQGMSDLCSPMIILLEDEADAFWCFERLMRRMRSRRKAATSNPMISQRPTRVRSSLLAVEKSYLSLFGDWRKDCLEVQ